MPQILSRREAREQGLPRYFTGKPCCRGHMAERNISKRCLECLREDRPDYDARYRGSKGWIESQDRYNASEKGRAVRKAASDKYAKTEKAKLRRVKFRESERGVEYSREYDKSETRKEYKRSKNQEPEIRFKNSHRRRLHKALMAQGIRKDIKTVEYLGCSSIELRKYIESLWKPEMSWSNYGLGKNQWQIDHIIPCAEWDLNCPLSRKLCFHHTNLQPLWYKDHKIKTRDDLKRIVEKRSGLQSLRP